MIIFLIYAVYLLMVVLIALCYAGFEIFSEKEFVGAVKTGPPPRIRVKTTVLRLGQWEIYLPASKRYYRILVDSSFILSAVILPGLLLIPLFIVMERHWLEIIRMVMIGGSVGAVIWDFCWYLMNPWWKKTYMLDKEGKGFWQKFWQAFRPSRDASGRYDALEGMNHYGWIVRVINNRIAFAVPLPYLWLIPIAIGLIIISIII